jgi:hypothetical protein
MIQRIISWFKRHQFYFCYSCKQIRWGGYYILYKENTLQATRWCSKCYDEAFVADCYLCGRKISVFQSPYDDRNMCPMCHQEEIDKELEELDKWDSPIWWKVMYDE